MNTLERFHIYLNSKQNLDINEMHANISDPMSDTLHNSMNHQTAECPLHLDIGNTDNIQQGHVTSLHTYAAYTPEQIWKYTKHRKDLIK
jgi:hypothetical protein